MNKRDSAILILCMYLADLIKYCLNHQGHLTFETKMKMSSIMGCTC